MYVTEVGLQQEHS